jgi:hypothetical protein
MKRQTLSFLVMGLVLLSLSSAAYSASVVTENLGVILTKQNPYPVEPGQVVDIEISLQNTGYGEAQNVILEINPRSPFSLLPGEDQTNTFSRISSQDHVTATYKLYVDKDAISNNYELEFKLYQAGDLETQKTQKVTLQVQGEPKLVIEKIETDPVDIEPGDTLTLTVAIKNVGTGSASLMEASFVSNTTYILPVLSGGLYYVGTINAGATGEAKFQMSIDNAAEYKTYTNMLLLTYNDESGTSATDSFYVGVPVRGEPIIEILSAKVEDSDFKVDIENIGTANAKALKIVLVQGDKIIDSAVANELRPAKYKSIRFHGFEYGQALINISYLDESNQFFSAEYPVTISVSSSSSEQGNEGGLAPLVPVLVVVVVLESYYVWRLRKRLKK